MLAFCGFWRMMIMNEEHRTSLRMSLHTMETLEEDAILFLNQTNIGPYINQILENFMDSSRANGDAELRKAEAEFLEDFHTIRRKMNAKSGAGRHSAALSASDQQMAQEMAALKVKRCCDALLSDHITDHKVFYLRKTVLDKLYPDTRHPDAWVAQDWYNRPGNFLRAILEDYASQSIYKREQICFLETMNVIRNELEKKESSRRTLIITYQKSAGLGQGQTETFEVIPYRFSREDEGDYNYLIGISHRLHDEDHPRPDYLAIFRVYGIQKVVPGPNKADPIPDSEKLEIENKVSRLGISYILGKEADCRVRLTQNGITMFNRYQHLRPRPDKIEKQEDGSAIYTFHCPYYRMEQYFQSFGNNAEVLSPDDLVKRFHDFYANALKNYSETPY